MRLKGKDRTLGVNRIIFLRTFGKKIGTCHVCVFGAVARVCVHLCNCCISLLNACSLMIGFRSWYSDGPVSGQSLLLAGYKSNVIVYQWFDY